MSNRATCPGCNTSFALSDQQRGKKVRCKKCARIFLAGDQTKPDDHAEIEDALEKLAGAIQEKPDRPGTGRGAAGPRRRLRDEDYAEEQPRSDRLSQKMVLLAVGGGVAVLVLLLIGIALLRWDRKPAPRAPASDRPQVAHIEDRRPNEIPPPVNPNPWQPPPVNPNPLQPPPVQPNPFQPLPVKSPGVAPPPAPARKLVWKVTPDPLAEPIQPPADARGAIPVPAGCSVWYPNTPSVHVAVGRNFFNTDATQVFNLQTKKPAGLIRGQIGLAEPIALSPDGRLLAGKFAASPVPAVDVWSFANGKPVRRIALDTMPANLEHLEFTGPSRFLTVKTTPQGKALQVWNVTTATTISQVLLPMDADWKSSALSANGKYLALCAQEKLFVYDLFSGDTVGEVVLPKNEGIFKLTCQGLAFAADGAELAGLFDLFPKSELISWDVAKGEVSVHHRFSRDVKSLNPLAGQPPGRALEWLPDRSGWLAYGQFMIDHSTGGLVWTVPAVPGDNIAPAPRRLLGKYQLTMTAGGPQFPQLLIAALPRAEIDAAFQTARAGHDSALAPLPPPRQADWSGLRRLPAPAGAVPWKAEPDTPQGWNKPLTRQPVALRSKGNEIERILFSSPENAQAVVLSVRVPNVLSTSKTVRVDRFDLAGGKYLKGLALFNLAEDTDQSHLADISQDGLTVAVREPREGSRVDVWSLADDRHVAGWLPYEKESGGLSQVSWVGFVDSRKLLTANPAGKLVWWSLPDCRALHESAPVLARAWLGAGSWAFSPGRKYLAAFNGQDVDLLDAADGVPQGQLARPSGRTITQVQSLAFRHDGLELAALALTADLQTLLIRWDTKKGGVLSEFAVPAGAAELDWCGPGHMLVGNALFDLGLRVPIGRYQLPGIGRHAQRAPDGRHWYAASPAASSEAPAYLTAQTLPDATVLQTAARAANPNSPALFRPGMTVDLRLDFAGPQADDMKKRLTTRLSGVLHGRNIKVVQGQAPVLTLQVQESDTGKTREFREIGVGRRTFTVSVKQLDCEISLSDAKGGVFWRSKQSLQTPSYGTVRKDENLEDKLAQQLWSNFEAWASGVLLPSFVLKVGDGVEALPTDSVLTGDR